MKPTIAFITGGYCPTKEEIEFNYKSSGTFTRNIDSEKYNVYTIDITAEGWFHRPTNGHPQLTVDRSDFTLVNPNGGGGEKVRFDLVFNGIAGTPGDDGLIQSYFELIGQAYTGSGVASSSLTFNKHTATAVAGSAGIPVAKSVFVIDQSDSWLAKIASQLSFPVFVKPNNGGSSIGVSKVASEDQLAGALKKAFEEGEGDQVLVEEFIQGREFTVGVLRTGQDDWLVLPITEVTTKNEFLDFAAKYHGQCEKITPAQLDERMAEQIRDFAQRVYKVFDCRGLVRIDLIYDVRKGEPHFLECNTLPGMTENSAIPHQVGKMGWTLKQFYTTIIEDALARKCEATNKCC